MKRTPTAVVASTIGALAVAGCSGSHPAATPKPSVTTVVSISASPSPVAGPTHVVTRVVTHATTRTVVKYRTVTASPTTPPVATTTNPPAPPTPKGASFGDGTFVVGQDIHAGTYRASSARDGCYWERDRDFANGDNSILANDNSAGPAIVTILPTDKGFQSQGCGTWTASLSRISASTTAISGDGTWAVGVDVEPGTYRSAGGQDCYWETDNDFTNGDNSIIANNNVTGPTVVTIPASAKAFKTSSCGSWQRAG